MATVLSHGGGINHKIQLYMGVYNDGSRDNSYDTSYGYRGGIGYITQAIRQDKNGMKRKAERKTKNIMYNRDRRHQRPSSNLSREGNNLRAKCIERNVCAHWT